MCFHILKNKPYYMNNVPLDGKVIPALFPSGRYKFEYNATAIINNNNKKNDMYLNWIAIVDIQNNPFLTW